MITKFEKYNESIKSLLVGPSKEDVWENLGYDKIFNRIFDTPEEFLLYIIDGMVINKKYDYKGYIFWEKNGIGIFEQDLKNMDLLVNHVIWGILYKFFNLGYSKIQSLIKSIVEEHLNWIGFDIGTNF